MDGFPYVATAVLPSSACGFSHAVTAICAVTALSIRSGCGFLYVVIAVQAENVFITLAVTAVSLSNEHGFSHAVMALQWMLFSRFSHSFWFGFSHGITALLINSGCGFLNVVSTLQAAELIFHMLFNKKWMWFSQKVVDMLFQMLMLFTVFFK